MTRERDLSIDVLRGVAAFFVVFTHVIQLYGDHSNNIVNNFMLALQIPLFMMVSGYTSKYSKPITTVKGLLNQIAKRSRILLLPWFTWSLLLYFIYRHQVPFFEHVANVAYHMEGAYWFLFSLWCLDLVNMVASYLANRCGSGGNYLLYLVAFFAQLAVFFGIGFLFGLSFLGIKYTLFYSLFFLLGYFLAKEKIEQFILQGNTLTTILLFVMSVLFFVAVTRMNIFELPEKPLFIMLRLAVSVMGCLMMFYTVKKIVWNSSKLLTKFLLWGGGKSLEIYVVHYLLLRIFLKVTPMNIDTVPSMVETVEYFLIILAVTYIVIEIINLNPISRLILFGKNYDRNGKAKKS